MPDREKVIEALETCRDQNNPPGYRFTSCVDDCPYNGNGCARKLKEDALALLKEQEEREQRICKSICNFIRGACSTDTDDDKDFVCYEIQKCFTEGR